MIEHRLLPRLTRRAALLAVVSVAACGGAESPQPAPADERQPVTPAGGQVVEVRDTTIAATLEASGIAEPFAQSTVSTRLMGAVTAVLVREGDVVRAGQPMVRIDARDLAARAEQVRAGTAAAEAAQREAQLHATRLRALYADSAAPRAQLDAAEAGLARAEAGVRAAQAGAAELATMDEYATVRAPFAGVVTQRLVDPGAFAAPGAPLITVQDHRRLRVAVTMAPSAALALRRGARVAVSIEGKAATGVVEAVTPASTPGLYAVNAVVENAGARYAAGGAATLQVPQGPRRAVLVPARAVRRQGDLTGVTLVSGTERTVRWVRLGAPHGDQVEVLSGLEAGSRIVVPDTLGGR